MTSALTTHIVPVAKTGTIAAVESAWAEAGGGAVTGLAEVDLRDCRFLDVPALVFLVARFVQRDRDELPTVLRLPRQRPVRDFLRDWEFPRALAEATGKTFRSLVVEDDHRYFGERSTDSDASFGRWGSEATLRGHAFPLRTFFAASREFGQRLATLQTADWQQRHVLAVLNSHLRGGGSRVATHVVHEAIMNAVRHPRATLVQTGAHFSFPGKNGIGHLTITVWDDGATIYDTLLGALRNGAQLTQTVPSELTRTFDVVLGDSDTVQQVSSATLPTAESSPELTLLSSFFPGVTSLPERSSSWAHRDVVADDAVYALPGMGLFVLMNTVIDVFGGEIAVRTGSFFMNLKSEGLAGDHALPRIRAKITKAGPGNSLLGNMLTARIPTRRISTAPE